MINHVPAFLELSGESLLGGDLVSFVCSLLKHQGAASVGPTSQVLRPTWEVSRATRLGATHTIAIILRLLSLCSCGFLISLFTNEYRGLQNQWGKKVLGQFGT